MKRKRWSGWRSTHVLPWPVLLAFGIALVLVVAACGGGDADSQDTEAAAEAPATTAEPAAEAEPPAETSAAAEETTTTAGEDFSIAIISQGLPNPHTKAEIDGAEAAAEDLGITVDVFDPAFDAVKQVNQLEDALTSEKYDGFLINCLDCGAIIPVIEQAIAKGKKVVTMASPLVGSDDATGYFDGTVSHINVTPVEQGEIMAQEVLDALPEGGNMVLIEGVAGQTGNEDFKRGFMSVMDQQDAVNIIADQYAEWDPNKAVTVMQAILEANRGNIDLLLTWADEMTIGPLQYLEAEGLLCEWPAESCDGKIKVIGQGITSAMLPELRDGKILSAWANMPYQHGYLGIQSLVGALNGEDVATNDPAHPSPPCPASGPCLFTPDTIPDDAEQYGIGY